LRTVQSAGYLSYSEADFEVFHFAGTTCCTDGGEIWQGGGDRDKFHPHQCSCTDPLLPMMAKFGVL